MFFPPHVWYECFDFVAVAAFVGDGVPFGVDDGVAVPVYRIDPTATLCPVADEEPATGENAWGDFFEPCPFC